MVFRDCLEIPKNAHYVRVQKIRVRGQMCVFRDLIFVNNIIWYPKIRSLNLKVAKFSNSFYPTILLFIVLFNFLFPRVRSFLGKIQFCEVWISLSLARTPKISDTFKKGSCRDIKLHTKPEYNISLWEIYYLLLSGNLIVLSCNKVNAFLSLDILDRFLIFQFMLPSLI